MQRLFNRLSAAALQMLFTSTELCKQHILQNKDEQTVSPSSNASFVTTISIKITGDIWWQQWAHQDPSRKFHQSPAQLSYAKICATVRSSSVSRRPFSSTNLGTASGANAKTLSTSWVKGTIFPKDWRTCERFRVWCLLIVAGGDEMSIGIINLDWSFPILDEALFQNVLSLP